MKKKREPLVWPPTVGQRICFDTGWSYNSWSAEVRAIVDDDWVVVKRWYTRRSVHRYVILNRWEVAAYNEPAAASPRGFARFWVGPLPKRCGVI